MLHPLIEEVEAGGSEGQGLHGELHEMLSPKKSVWGWTGELAQ